MESVPRFASGAELPKPRARARIRSGSASVTGEAGIGERPQLAMDQPLHTRPEDRRVSIVNQRGCYCDLWDTNPALYEKLGYQRGFCGSCERCGAPGHTRHFPGPVPYTGAWCDKCYQILKWTWPFRSVIGWIYIVAGTLILFAIGGSIFSAIGRALH